MYTYKTAELEAKRLVKGVKAAGRTQQGFLDLLDDKGYVPAEPKVETRLEKTTIAMMAGVLSMGHKLRDAYDWVAAPEFDFLDLLAAKGQVPPITVLAAPDRKGVNDNWPATGKAAA